jgi:hypothetical protein
MSASSHLSIRNFKVGLGQSDLTTDRGVPHGRAASPSLTALSDRQALIISRSVSRSRRIADAWLRRPVVEGGYGEASLLEKEAVNSRDTEFRKSEKTQFTPVVTAPRNGASSRAGAKRAVAKSADATTGGRSRHRYLLTPPQVVRLSAISFEHRTIVAS